MISSVRWFIHLIPRDLSLSRSCHVLHPFSLISIVEATRAKRRGLISWRWRGNYQRFVRMTTRIRARYRRHRRCPCHRRGAARRLISRTDAARRDVSLFPGHFLFLSAVLINDNHRHSHCNLRRRAFYVTGTNETVTTCCSDALTRTTGMSVEQRLHCLRNLTDLLHRAFKGQFVFPALGHEDMGVNYTHLANLWQNWLPPEAVDTFVKGTYTSKSVAKT